MPRVQHRKRSARAGGVGGRGFPRQRGGCCVAGAGIAGGRCGRSLWGWASGASAMTETNLSNGTNARPLVSAGLALGIGLGGFVDGIVFRQLLQAHHMLSARREPTSVV